MQEWNSETKAIEQERTLGKLEYRVVCGEIAVDSPDGEIEKRKSGKVFYTAYFVKKPERPVLFLFNGGPGGSSCLLHFGGLGPKRVDHLDIQDWEIPSSLVDHQETLLHKCDLVFVDPIGTGFSSCREELLKEFCTEQADVKYLGQFITFFLNQHKLWGRSIQLCGESYGAYRVCLLSQHLITKYQIHPRKLLFIAPFISGVAIESGAPNILAEANTLVSFIAISWFHHRSALNTIHKNIASVYADACNFCFNEYLPERLKNYPFALPEKLLKKICEWTGIDLEVYIKHGLSISTWSQFLFAGEKRYPGYVDGRFILEHPLTFTPSFLDPSTTSIDNKMIPLANAYFTQDIGWQATTSYTSFNPEVGAVWRFEEPFFASAFAGLRNAMKLNPSMQVYAAAGYYDLAVPAACVQYDLKQIADTQSLANRITLEIFEAGHMMYIHKKSRIKLLEAFSKVSYSH